MANMNDSNQTDKRLMQDNKERDANATVSSVIAILIIVLIVAFIVAYIFYGKNILAISTTETPAQTVPMTTTIPTNAVTTPAPTSVTPSNAVTTPAQH